jgi:hypothetical protein
MGLAGLQLVEEAERLLQGVGRCRPEDDLAQGERAACGGVEEGLFRRQVDARVREGITHRRRLRGKPVRGQGFDTRGEQDLALHVEHRFGGAMHGVELHKFR